MKIRKSTANAQRTTLDAQPAVELRIEELVLDGFAPAQRYAIGDALERELTRLLATQFSVQPESSAQDWISGEDIHLRLGLRAREVGERIGRSVIASLTTHCLGPISSKRDVRVNQGSVHDNHSAQINQKGK